MGGLCVRQEMSEESSKYDSYVEHPRFGRGPRITGLNVIEDLSNPQGPLLWIYPPESKIPNTGIVANTELQKINSFPTHYYFDQERVCLDCKHPFIWFAEEQKHWFEDLGFYLLTDCVRCVHCRQRRKGRTSKGDSDSKRSNEEGEQARSSNGG